MIKANNYYILKAVQNLMKIGLLVPIGRTDKYGYQYEELMKLIINNYLEFTDKIIVISSSRFAKRELLEVNPKIEFISNEDTWFQLENSNEIFSFQKLIDNMNYIRDKLKEEEYDVAIQIHINQYIPESSGYDLRKQCQKMLKIEKPYEWLYKSYQIGNLIFHADIRVPWIYNLSLDNPWNYYADSLLHKNSGEMVKIQKGNFKKFDKCAIRDIFGEFTLQDIREKYEYTIKELRMLNNTYDPDNLENLKFDIDVWVNYMVNKFGNKKKSKSKLDFIGERILNIRKKDFVSIMFQDSLSK